MIEVMFIVLAVLGLITFTVKGSYYIGEKETWGCYHRFFFGLFTHKTTP